MKRGKKGNKKMSKNLRLASKYNLDPSVIEAVDSIDSREGVVGVANDLLNLLMLKEREFYLKEEAENKANGFYDRKLATALGNLGLTVPRDRKGVFRPSIMPETWKRSDISFDDFLHKLVFQSYSPNKIKSLLESMGMPYSAEQIEELKAELYGKAKELKTRELPDKAFCIYIDAYHTDVKNDETKKVCKAVIYSVIGIDLNGKKSLFGYYVMDGHETREDWIGIFNDLISRGLKRLMLVISDDFTGLSDAVASLFPNTDHQLCFVHLQRNVRRNLSKDSAKDFNYELSVIKKQRNLETASEMFSTLCEKYKKENKSFIDYILKKKDLYLSYLKFPVPIQKHIYTTNTVENFNSRLEVTRVNSGGYFQSKRTADVAIYVVANRLETSKWSKPMLRFIESQYEIMQMFNLKFRRENHE
jgi:putative transposase